MRLSVILVRDPDTALSDAIERVRPVCPAGTELLIVGRASALPPAGDLCLGIVPPEGDAPAAHARAGVRSATGDAVLIVDGTERLLDADLPGALQALAERHDTDAVVCGWVDDAEGRTSFGSWPPRNASTALLAGLVPPLSAFVWRRTALVQTIRHRVLSDDATRPLGRHLALGADLLGLQLERRTGPFVQVRTDSTPSDPAELRRFFLDWLADDGEADSFAFLRPRLDRVRLDHDRIEARRDDGSTLSLDAHEALLATLLVRDKDARPRSIDGWVAQALGDRNLPAELAPALRAAAVRLLERGAYHAP